MQKSTYEVPEGDWSSDCDLPIYGWMDGWMDGWMYIGRAWGREGVKTLVVVV